jgi:hypothetical protein
LQAQLAGFKERAKSDPAILVERSDGKRGERGAGGIGWPLALLLVFVVAGVKLGRRRV